MRDRSHIYQGIPGPGILLRHIARVRRLASRIGIPLVIFGSRQSGVSCHTGKPFRAESDVDLGFVGSAGAVTNALMRLGDVGEVEDWNVPNVEHYPMAIFRTPEEAVAKGYVVVFAR